MFAPSKKEAKRLFEKKFVAFVFVVGAIIAEFIVGVTNPLNSLAFVTGVINNNQHCMLRGGKYCSGALLELTHLILI